MTPSLIYTDSYQLLFSVINSSLFPTQQTDVNSLFFIRRSSNFRGDPLCREIAPLCKRIMLSHQILFSMQSNSCRRVTVLCWFFFFQAIVDPEIFFHRLSRFFFRRNTSSNLITTFWCEYPCPQVKICDSNPEHAIKQFQIQNRF